MDSLRYLKKSMTLALLHQVCYLDHPAVERDIATDLYENVRTVGYHYQNQNGTYIEGPSGLSYPTFWELLLLPLLSVGVCCLRHSGTAPDARYLAAWQSAPTPPTKYVGRHVKQGKTCAANQGCTAECSTQRANSFVSVKEGIGEGKLLSCWLLLLQSVVSRLSTGNYQ